MTDEEVREEIINRLNTGAERQEYNPNILDAIKQRFMLGKQMIQNPTLKGIAKPAAEAVGLQLGNYVGTIRNNKRLKQERRILRELVKEKKQNKGRILDQKAREGLAVAKTNFAEMMKTDPTQAILQANKAVKSLINMRLDQRAGKPAKRRTKWNGNDTMQLLYGGPIGLISTGIRHKRQNDVNALEDEYKLLQSQGYGSIKDAVKSLVRLRIRPLRRIRQRRSGKIPAEYENELLRFEYPKNEFRFNNFNYLRDVAGIY